jgi:hypothetical protein
MPKNGGGSAKPEPKPLKFGGPEPLGPIEVYAYGYDEFAGNCVHVFMQIADRYAMYCQQPDISMQGARHEYSIAHLT